VYRDTVLYFDSKERLAYCVVECAVCYLVLDAYEVAGSVYAFPSSSLQSGWTVQQLHGSSQDNYNTGCLSVRPSHRWTVVDCANLNSTCYDVVTFLTQ
jgi:hypothetical protein